MFGDAGEEPIFGEVVDDEIVVRRLRTTSGSIVKNRFTLPWATFPRTMRQPNRST